VIFRAYTEGSLPSVFFTQSAQRTQRFLVSF
jgi:hypothetical protein